MRILLDTHVFLGFISGDRKLSRILRDRLRDSENEVFLSAVPIWEAIMQTCV
jgi:PIN domain nuclease of toxin-antitoxin system